jgi:endonuclease/exonuclease/phosphatase family metal-dependent hydrolase
MKLISVNIWFDNYLKYERINLLLDYILKNKPDIIFLQEVKIDILSFLYKKIEFIYKYIHFSVEENNYGLVILSKNEIKNREYYKFNNSKMGRGILFCEINNIIFATTHLESVFKNEKTKIDQFNNSIKLLSKYNNVIFGGDMNLKKELDSFNFIDMYDNSKNNKFTYDGLNNLFIKNKYRNRLDRIYYKGSFKINNFNLNKEYIVSDHFILEIDF